MSTNNNELGTDRRSFLKTAAGVAGVTSLPGCNNQEDNNSNVSTSQPTPEDYRQGDVSSENYNAADEFEFTYGQSLEDTDLTRLEHEFLGGLQGEVSVDQADTIYDSGMFSDLQDYEGLSEQFFDSNGEIKQDYLDSEGRLDDEAVSTQLDNLRNGTPADDLVDITGWYNENYGTETSTVEGNSTVTSGNNTNVTATNSTLTPTNTSVSNSTGNTTNQTQTGPLQTIELPETSYTDFLGVYSDTRDAEVSDQFVSGLDRQTFRHAHAAQQAGERYEELEASELGTNDFISQVFAEDSQITQTEVEFLAYELGAETGLPEDPYADDWSGDGVTNLAAMELFEGPMQTQQLFANDEKHQLLDIDENGDILYNRQTWIRPDYKEEVKQEDIGTLELEINRGDWDAFKDRHDAISAELGGQTQKSYLWDDEVDFDRDQALRGLNRFALTHLDRNAEFNPEELSPSESIAQITGAALEDSTDGERLLRNIEMINGFTDAYTREGHFTESLDFYELAARSMMDANGHDLFEKHSSEYLDDEDVIDDIIEEVRREQGPLTSYDSLKSASQIVRDHSYSGGGGGSNNNNDGGDDGPSKPPRDGGDIH